MAEPRTDYRMLVAGQWTDGQGEPGLTDYCNYFAGRAETAGGQTIPSSVPDMFVYTAFAVPRAVRHGEALRHRRSRRGATLLTGGRHLSGAQFCLIPFTDEDEAIAIGNASLYGLAAGVWTRDIARAQRVCARLRAGTVWINTCRRTNYAVPFGGVNPRA